MPNHPVFEDVSQDIFNSNDKIAAFDDDGDHMVAQFGDGNYLITVDFKDDALYTEMASICHKNASSEALKLLVNALCLQKV